MKSSLYRMWKSQGVLTRRFLVLVTSLFWIFCITRFADLAARPMHNDESVNSGFLMNLMKSNSYKYDPTNFHGPSLPYIQLIPTAVYGYFLDGPKEFRLKNLSGMTSTSIRVSVAAAGMLILLGFLLAFNRLGKWGALAAFLLGGLSCNLLFVSRYYIHEIFVVLFTFGIYLALTYYNDTKRKVYFYAAAASAALLFCTKETSVITFAVLILAAVSAEITQPLLTGTVRTGLWKILRTRATTAWGNIRTMMPAAMGIGILIWAVLFSSVFSNPQGLLDSVRAFKFWYLQGVDSDHIKPFLYFINELLARYEFAVLCLSIIGLVIAFLKNEKRGLFLAFWAMGIIAAYSLIPYKTPWLVVNMLLPMILVAGYGIQSIVQFLNQEKPFGNPRVRTVLAVGFVALLLFQVPQTLKIVYWEYDSERHIPVYVGTRRDVYDMVEEIDHVARKTSQGRNLKIHFVTPVHHPLAFYLRNYRHLNFWKKIDPTADLDASIIIAQPSQQAELLPLLKDTYTAQVYSFFPNDSFLMLVNDTHLAMSNNRLPDVHDFLEPISISAPMKNGLVERVYQGTKCAGRPIRTTRGLTALNFWWDHEHMKPQPTPFSLEWEGYLRIPFDGSYLFGLESDDGSWLYLDDQLVLDNGGDHALVKMSRRVNLKKGLHKIKVRYFDAFDKAILRLTWAPPGGTEGPIPAEVLVHSLH